MNQSTVHPPSATCQLNTHLLPSAIYSVVTCKTEVFLTWILRTSLGRRAAGVDGTTEGAQWWREDDSAQTRQRRRSRKSPPVVMLTTATAPHSWGTRSASERWWWSSSQPRWCSVSEGSAAAEPVTTRWWRPTPPWAPSQPSAHPPPRSPDQHFTSHTIPVIPSTI